MKLFKGGKKLKDMSQDELLKRIGSEKFLWNVSIVNFIVSFFIMLALEALALIEKKELPNTAILISISLIVATGIESIWCYIEKYFIAFYYMSRFGDLP